MDGLLPGLVFGDDPKGGLLSEENAKGRMGWVSADGDEASDYQKRDRGAGRVIDCDLALVCVECRMSDLIRPCRLKNISTSSAVSVVLSEMSDSSSGL